MVILLILLAVCLMLLWIRTANLKALLRDLRQETDLRLAAPDRLSEEVTAEVSALRERQLAAEQQHRRREQQLRQELAGLSHDLRTPLTSLCGYLQMLEQGTLSPEEQQKALAVVRHRADALQQLIAGVYDLSRLEAAADALTPEPVRLQNLIASLAADEYQRLNELGMTPEINLPETLPPVLADPAGAERVLQNLLQNALRHGKSLSMTARTAGSRVLTVFENDAPNLTDADLPQLFDRFYRVGGQSGAGLGLSIVKELCEAMDAQVTARLQEGRLRIEILWKTAEQEG